MRDLTPEDAQGLKNEATGDEDESYVDYYYDDPGDIPGTLYIEEDASPPALYLIDYCPTQVTFQQLATPEEVAPYLDTQSVSWVDVRGLGSEDVLRRLGKVFDLHPLILEDVVNVPQRPKLEEHNNQLLIIARMVCPRGSGDEHFISEQVSFILGKQYLLTVQEEPEFDVFTPVRERIRQGKGVIRNQGADYLAYTLLDSIIDGFYPVLETFGERIEDLEDEVVDNPTRETIEKIHELKRELLSLRRAIWPQRDVVNSLIRDGHHLVSDEVRVYLRDCYDHAIQILDMVETYRELTSSLMDVYLSSISNRMNEVMKTLTVISVIFIPLTFIAGVYGMNFKTDLSPWNMPELSWYFGYPFSLVLMLLVALGLVFYFWRQGWFESFSGIRSKKR